VKETFGGTLRHAATHPMECNCVDCRARALTMVGPDVERVRTDDTTVAWTRYQKANPSLDWIEVTWMAEWPS